uniref:Uncharacterized protein n=1 Tax=Rhizophora mucronata TaxID=61149 RepID=A0A2P2Q488_RHIMU
MVTFNVRTFTKLCGHLKSVSEYLRKDNRQKSHIYTVCFLYSIKSFKYEHSKNSNLSIQI